jgi:peptidoglycan/LPS O-acetylase OafA/YrhL
MLGTEQGAYRAHQPGMHAGPNTTESMTPTGQSTSTSGVAMRARDPARTSPVGHGRSGPPDLAGGVDRKSGQGGRSRAFLPYVHGFRAIAILFVVGAHSIWVLNWHDNPATEAFLADFIENGTVLFVFVAGFLFEHLESGFRYRSYLLKKLRNVVSPYLVISTPVAIHDAYTAGIYRRYPDLVGTSGLHRVLWFLVKGGAGTNVPLWFVPMIIIFYLAAPVFMLLARVPRLYWSLLALLPLSLLAHRTSYPNLDTAQLALYYLSAYVAGMCSSHHRIKLEPVLVRIWPVLTGLFLAATAVMWRFSTHHGNYEGLHLFSQEHGAVDWLFAQKLLLCFALLGMLLRCERWAGPRLRLLGDVSFSIFFVHYLFISVFRHFASTRVIPGFADSGDLLNWLVLAAATSLASLGLAVLVKRTAGRRSRLLIGS